MSQEVHPQFDDPALKDALKRALGAEAAPPGLRGRIERALSGAAGAEAPATPPKKAFNWRNSPLVGLAAAVLIIISVGVILNEGMPRWLVREKFTAPDEFYADMVAAHERMIGQPAHTLEVPQDDLQQIRQTLREKLGHPVLVASLGPDWKFEGASVSAVGSTPAAQLIFSRGNDTISLFSFKGNAYYATAPDGTEYRHTYNGHPVAGVVKGATIHCIVGSKGTKLTEKDLARLRDRISDEVSSISDTNCGGGSARPVESARM